MQPYVQTYTGSSLGVAFGAAYADVSGISAPVAAGAVYQVSGYFVYRVSATTVGLAAALNGPTASMLSGKFVVQTNPTTGAATVTGHGGYRPSSIAVTNGSATGADLAVTFDAVVVPTASGVLTVSFKGGGSAGTATVSAGGRLIVSQIA